MGDFKYSDGWDCPSCGIYHPDRGGNPTIFKKITPRHTTIY